VLAAPLREVGNSIGACSRLRTDYGETGIICGCIGVDRGVGVEFSISLNNEKHKFGWLWEKALWLRRLDLNHERLGLPSSLVHNAAIGVASECGNRCKGHSARNRMVRKSLNPLRRGELFGSNFGSTLNTDGEQPLELLTSNLPEREFPEEIQQVAMKPERPLLLFIDLLFASSHQFSMTTVTVS
jgi:hypothetical protein